MVLPCCCRTRERGHCQASACLETQRSGARTETLYLRRIDQIHAISPENRGQGSGGKVVVTELSKGPPCPPGMKHVSGPVYRGEFLKIGAIPECNDLPWEVASSPSREVFKPGVEEAEQRRGLPPRQGILGTGNPCTYKLEMQTADSDTPHINYSRKGARAPSAEAAASPKGTPVDNQ